MNGFLNQIAMAQYNKVEWVETTPEVINHFNRNGVGKVGYFIFNGIKVCEVGKLQTILGEESIPLSERIHGAEEGTVISGGSRAAEVEPMDVVSIKPDFNPSGAV